MILPTFSNGLIVLGSSTGCTYQFTIILGHEWIIWGCDVYARCEMQCLLSKTIFRMSYFEVYELFHLSLNVLINQSEETSNNTDNLWSLLNLPSVFLNLKLLREIVSLHRPKISTLSLKLTKRYYLQPDKMNFAGIMVIFNKMFSRFFLFEFYFIKIRVIIHTNHVRLSYF